MAEIIRGTTPVIQCVLPFNASEIAEAFLTVHQRGNTVLEKNIDDAVKDGTMLSFALTQEDTIKLDDRAQAEAQVRAKTTGGSALASNIVEISVRGLLKEGVI